MWRSQGGCLFPSCSRYLIHPWGRLPAQVNPNVPPFWCTLPPSGHGDDFTSLEIWSGPVICFGNRLWGKSHYVTSGLGPPETSCFCFCLHGSLLPCKQTQLPARERPGGKRSLEERGFGSACPWLLQPPQLRCQTCKWSYGVDSSSREPPSQGYVEQRQAVYTEPFSNCSRKQINAYCFQLLSLGVFCYVATANWNNSHLD